jgi:ankyrin repeat protein
MSKSNKNDINNIIDMELEDYYTKEHNLYYITKKDKENIINSLLYKNVDLILDTILDKFNYKNTKNIINKDDINYFENILKNCKEIINNKTKDGDTLLHNMVFFGCYDMVYLLIKYGAKIDIVDTDNQIPLHRSIFLSDLNVFDLLIKNSSDLKKELNHQDKDGNTVLHLAIIIKNYMIIKNLLKNGADPYILNNANIIPIDLAKDKNKKFDEYIIKIFKKYMN